MPCTNLGTIEVGVENPVYSSREGVMFNKSQTTLIQCPGGKMGAYAIPDSVIEIGGWAFCACNSLTRVTIPEGVTSIEGGTFSYCESLTDLTIPGSVMNIGDGAFRSCTSLSGVYFEGDGPDIPSGVFSGANAVSLYFRPGSLNWPDTVAGRPTALWIPLSLGNPSEPLAAPLRLRSGTPAPAELLVQRSTNLRDWEDWQTVSRTEGPGELNDPDAGASPYRFYRVVEIDGN
ncbi:MAG: leucine-rich repeat domain-containing protein [Verrucomicrobiales bacterium]|nr:leucine-rich repeat domain-containing protein [Verrucomicrobiales bacterium]